MKLKAIILDVIQKDIYPAELTIEEHFGSLKGLTLLIDLSIKESSTFSLIVSNSCI